MIFRRLLLNPGHWVSVCDTRFSRRTRLLSSEIISVTWDCDSSDRTGSGQSRPHGVGDYTHSTTESAVNNAFSTILLITFSYVKWASCCYFSASQPFRPDLRYWFCTSLWKELTELGRWLCLCNEICIIIDRFHSCFFIVTLNSMQSKMPSCLRS